MATEPRRSARTRKGLRKKLPAASVRGEYEMLGTEAPFVKQSIIKQIRSLRSRLGREMFSLYDDMEPLRIKHFELSKSWTPDELLGASERVLRLTKVVAIVKRKIDQIAQSAGLARVNEKRMHEASVDMNRALRFLLRIIPTGELREMLGEGMDAAQVYFMDNFNKGVGMLRFAWSKLFYVTAAEPLVMTLSDAETYIWYRALEEGNKPPAAMIEEFEAYANERGVPVEVYDHEGRWVWSQPPYQHLGERPLALAIAMKEPRRARQRWGFRRVEASSGRALAEQLSADEQKLVQEFLERNQGRSFTLDEIATYAGVGIRDVKPEGAAVPNYQGSSKSAQDDLALHRAVMLMDLEGAGSEVAGAMAANPRAPLTKREMQLLDRLQQQGLSRGIHPYNVRIGKTLESLIAKGYVERRGAFFYPGESKGSANPRYGRSSAGPGIFADSYEEAEEEVRALVAGSVGPGTSPAEVVVKHTTAQIDRQIEEMKDHLGNAWILTPEGQRLEAERRLSLRRRTRKNGSRAKRVSVSPLSKADVLAQLEEAENLAYSPRAFPPGRTLEARNIIGHLWAESNDAGNDKFSALLEHLDEVSDRDLSGAIEDVIAAVS